MVTSTLDTRTPLKSIFQSNVSLTSTPDNHTMMLYSM
jgi:hypothetical protein